MNAIERTEIQGVISDIEKQLKRLKVLLPKPVKTSVKITQGAAVDKSRLAPYAGRKGGSTRPKNHGMGEDGRQQ